MTIAARSTSVTPLQMKVRRVHLADFSRTRLQRGTPLHGWPSLPSSLWDHLDRRERQFITPQRGKDKPHLMKQPRQSCIKSHRNSKLLSNLPSSPQWVSGTADDAQLVKRQVHWCRQPGLLLWCTAKATWMASLSCHLSDCSGHRRQY